MNNDDKSQAPDTPQVGYIPPPVAPGAQYPGVPNANNYNQSQTPPNIPTVSPTPPVAPRPPASKSPMIAIISAFIVGIPHAYYARGYVYNRLGEYAKAESDFSKALELSPENTSYLIGRLEAYDLQKKYTEELADIDFILRKNGSKEPQIAIEKGRVQLLLGDTVAAFRTMDSVVGRHSYLAAAWGGRALINMLMEKNDSALADYNVAISLRTDNAEHYINRANLFYKKHNYRATLEDPH